MSHVIEDVADKLALNRSLFFPFLTHTHTPMNYTSENKTLAALQSAEHVFRGGVPAAAVRGGSSPSRCQAASPLGGWWAQRSPSSPALMLFSSSV